MLLFGTGEWRRIVPTSRSVFPGARESLKIYAGFGVPSLEHFQPYDALQQLMYFTVLFIAAPLTIVTGPVMSPAGSPGPPSCSVDAGRLGSQSPGGASFLAGPRSAMPYTEGQRGSRNHKLNHLCASC